MEPDEPVVPVYDGPGLASLVPALLGATDASWLPAAAAGASSVVLLVLDGLGWEALDVHADALGGLRSLEGRRVTAVAPSTTAAALTSITTGVAPSRHGLVGFRILVDGAVLNALSWSTDGRRAPDPTLVQRQAPFRGRAVPVVTKREFQRSGFTAAHLRGCPFAGWRTTSELVGQCRRLVAEQAPLVYAYYPGVDEVAHAHGLHDGFYEAELAFVDRLVGDLLDVLPERAALVVTADHGQVHLDAESWLPLAGELDGLVARASGDGRFRYLHARPGAADDLAAAARDAHGAHAWVRSRAELLADGWLGPDPVPATRRRIGDVVLAARGQAAFVDPALPRETGLRSGHGSLTASEMWVPLLAGRGRAGS